MIPREILKKIRQIEIRTNRIVTETLAGASLQPAQECLRISRAMENGNNIYDLRSNQMVNAVFAKPFKPDLTSGGRCTAKSFGKFLNLLERSVDFNSPFFAQASTLFFVPSRRIFEFQAGQRREDNRAPHSLRDCKRSWSSACTVSHGIPRSGCSRNSSARRSSSAICSGVSSSSNLSRSCSKTSRCSSTGSRSICSKTRAALMAAIYFFDLRVHAGFSHANSSFRIHNSAFR